MSGYILHTHIYTTCQSLDTPYEFMTIDFMSETIKVSNNSKTFHIEILQSSHFISHVLLYNDRCLAHLFDVFIVNLQDGKY